MCIPAHSTLFHRVSQDEISRERGFFLKRQNMHTLSARMRKTDRVPRLAVKDEMYAF